MAKRFSPFDLWFPAAEDFLFESSSRADEIRQRWFSNHTWGIVRDNSYSPRVNIPVSGIDAAPTRKWAINQFPIKLDCQTGLVSVGEGSTSQNLGGVAFDQNGDLIFIDADAPFNFATAAPQGSQSTGNTNIPLNPTGVTGGYLANPSLPGVYYLWIEYLEVNDNVPIIAKDGSTHYPQVEDGYRIRVTTTPNAPTADGLSVFLCQITWVGGSGVLNVIDGRVAPTTGPSVGNILDTNPAGIIGRVFCGVRDNQVEIFVDLTGRTLIYGDKLLATLRDHINAFGDGTPTFDNPHAIALKNIPGAGSEPVAMQNQADSLNQGIIDLNAPQNSPASNGTAASGTINNLDLVPLSTLEGGLDPSVKRAWIRVLALSQPPTVPSALARSAFVEGNRLKRLYPRMQDTVTPGPDSSVVAADADSGDGWVGFSDTADAPGYYWVYGSFFTTASGTDVLLLNKTPDPIIVANFWATNIKLFRVYWDGNNLLKNAGSGIGLLIDDFRSLGLVGPQQISTEAKADANTGILSQEVLENLTANSNYFLDADLSQVSVGCTVIDGGGLFFGANPPTKINATQDITLKTGGPATISGMKLTPVGNSVSAGYLYHILQNLKPNKLYGLSFWYKAQVGFNARMQVDLSRTNDGLSNSLLAPGIQDFSISTENADNLWHRGQMVLLTGNSVDSDYTVAKYLEFRFSQPVGGVTAAFTFEMTNISLTEGEWVPGYMAGRYIPHGSIIAWDLTDSCPPGFEQVHALDGRAPYGVDANVIRGVSAGALNPSVPGSLTGATDSSFDPQGGAGQLVYDSALLASGGGTFMRSTGGKSAGPVQLTHTHTMDGSIPYYGLLYCRAM